MPLGMMGGNASGWGLEHLQPLVRALRGSSVPSGSCMLRFLSWFLDAVLGGEQVFEAGVRVGLLLQV